MLSPERTEHTAKEQKVVVLIVEPVQDTAHHQRHVDLSRLHGRQQTAEKGLVVVTSGTDPVKKRAAFSMEWRCKKGGIYDGMEM